MDIFSLMLEDLLIVISGEEYNMLGVCIKHMEIVTSLSSVCYTQLIMRSGLLARLCQEWYVWISVNLCLSTGQRSSETWMNHHNALCTSRRDWMRSSESTLSLASSSPTCKPSYKAMKMGTVQELKIDSSWICKFCGGMMSSLSPKS